MAGTANRTVAIVGGRGFIGSALAMRLRAAGHAVLTIDRGPGADTVIDITAPTAEAELTATFRAAHVAAVAHLAATLTPIPRGDVRASVAAHRVHVDGTRAVARAIHAAAVSRAVLVSSATVYGAHADNPVPMGEDQPLRPNAFSYAQNKAAQERTWNAELGEVSSAIARPAIVYGPGARNYLTEILRRARFILPAVDGKRPPLQFVHVDDVCTAIGTLLQRTDATGPFNVAPMDWLTFEEVARLRGVTPLSVPSAIVRPLLDRLAPWMPDHLRATSDVLPYLSEPFVISPARLIATTRWAPHHTSEAALASLDDQ